MMPGNFGPVGPKPGGQPNTASGGPSPAPQNNSAEVAQLKAMVQALQARVVALECQMRVQQAMIGGLQQAVYSR